MNGNVCPQCGAPIEAGAVECRYCGEKLPQQAQYQQVPPQPQYQQQQYQQVPPQPQVIIQQAPPQPQQVYMTRINPAWPVKSKVTAGVLAILLGGIGVHKFYLGRIGVGIIYLLFCWTYIPGIIAFIEGIMYLCQSDEDFQVKNQVRIG